MSTIISEVVILLMTYSCPMTHPKVVNSANKPDYDHISWSMGRADACWRKAESRHARMLPAALRYSPATLAATAASLTDQVKKVREAAWSGSLGMSCKMLPGVRCMPAETSSARQHTLSQNVKALSHDSYRVNPYEGLAAEHNCSEKLAAIFLARSTSCRRVEGQAPGCTRSRPGAGCTGSRWPPWAAAPPAQPPASAPAAAWPSAGGRCAALPPRTAH